MPAIRQHVPTFDPGLSPSEIWRSLHPTARELATARRRLHAKALCVLGGVLLSYWTLVIADLPSWARFLSGLVLVGCLIATATGIMHDANHGSFSSRDWINRAAACSADFLGASSWLWRFKHNRLHHGHTNVAGVDSDLAQEPFARLEPTQTWRRWHRWQHLYLWILYGFFALKNVVIGDLRSLWTARIGETSLPHRPQKGTWTRIAVGKGVHLSWAVVVPMLFNPWWKVLLWYVGASWLVGFFLAVVFQLAHCVDLAEFPRADLSPKPDFVEHQMLTTVDITTTMPIFGPLFRWLVGGLDHQLEHHLAPRLPHNMYPQLAERFHVACDLAGVTVRRHAGLWAALRSHARWLVEMGRCPTPSF